MQRLKKGVTWAPKQSARLARRTAQTTFRVTLGAVVTTEHESVRLVRSVILRGSPSAAHRAFPRRFQNDRDFETHIEEYIKYLLNLRHMPTLTEVKQLEETIGRLLVALDEVLEEKNRIKAEHAGEVPNEWIEEMVAMLGRKPRPADVSLMRPASPPPPPSPSGDHASGPPPQPARPEGASQPAAKPTPKMAEPFRGYHTLSGAQILTQIPALTPQQLRKVQQYEERHHRRVTILRAVENQLAALGEAPGAGSPTES